MHLDLKLIFMFIDKIILNFYFKIKINLLFMLHYKFVIFYFIFFNNIFFITHWQFVTISLIYKYINTYKIINYV